MRKKRRQEQEAAAHAELLSRELGWLEASSRKSTKIIFGAPMRCPSVACVDFGLVLAVEAGRQHNRCVACGTAWSLSRRAMSMFALACKEPKPEEVVGDGTLVVDLEAPSAARTTRERIASMRTALQRDLQTPGTISYLPNS